MPDTRTSREIIWQHAFDYRWTRVQDINGNPAVDAFFDRPRQHYADEPRLIVWYSRNGQRITDASFNGYRMRRHRRGDVMDAIESRHA